ncbi:MULTISPECIES: hypothetical protein [Enterococcus]|nr:MULTISPECIES: hypothetical protein [Enterococcus]DAT60383.1 MAG TPA: PROTEIN/RNA Complex, Sec61, translocation, translation, eEF2 [Caudoviricetes sp.]
MSCPICNGDKVVWQGDGTIGVLKCKPCPGCNKKAVQQKSNTDNRRNPI